jgi:Putative zinc-finger
MPEHISAGQAERFRQRRLQPAELIATYDHIALCEECRQLLSEAEQPQIALSGFLADLAATAEAKSEHLSHDQIAAYVDGYADEVERERVESHVERCSSCAVELRDLQELQAKPPRWTVLENLPVWKRIAGFFQLPRRRIPLQIAATAAIVALLVWVATLPLRNEVADVKAQLSRLQQTNDALRKEALAAAELRAEISELRKATEDLRRNYTTAAARVEKLESRRGSGPTRSLPAGNLTNLMNDASGLVSVDAGGNVTLPVSLASLDLPPVKAALITGRAETPSELAAITGSSPGGLRSRGVGVSFSLRSPVGTMVETDRPTFSWDPLSGANSYVVVVYDSSFRPVESSEALAATEWTVPRPLQRGRIYSWQVTALKDGQEFKSPTAPGPDAKFKILASESGREIERARRNYAGSHLVLGVLSAKAGLLDDAEREFAALAQRNPGSTTAQKLLSSIRALRQPAR